MQEFPDLRGVQSLFWKLLTAPTGASQGAAELARRGEIESEDLGFLVRPDARLKPVERLEIYADMYFYRLRDCLAEDYPKVAAHVGQARFHNLVTDYLLEHPSTHFSLREAGRALPGFLRTHPLTGEFPTLPDLAQLEWARVDVFDDADAAPLTRDALLRGAAAAPQTFAVTLVPSARLIRVDASALRLWKGLQGQEGGREGDEPKSRFRGETRGVRVWRKGFAVFHGSLQADEERCLEAMAGGGTTVAQLGELLLEQAPSNAPPEHAAQRLAELLDLWTRDELLTPCRSLSRTW